MNAVYFNTRGGPDALVYGAATMPRAGEGEIVVRVRAAAVTPTELQALLGIKGALGPLTVKRLWIES
jgi:NADPH:quinone reductase-like Zn-dependent oxidoreductase